MASDERPAPPPSSGVHRFTCDACGGQQGYDPDSAALRCTYCGVTRPVAADGDGPGPAHDYDAVRATSGAAARGFDTGPTRVASCRECGAHVAFPDGVVATRCTFCGSSHVLDEAASNRVLRPESIVPFAVDTRRARAAFDRWLGRLWFRPRDLRRSSRVEALAGVYVPFWSYSAHADASWRAEAGHHYWVEEEVDDEEPSIQGGPDLPPKRRDARRTRRVRHTRWEAAWGTRADDFDDLLVCASHGLPRDLADNFRTYNMRRLRPYSPAYLAGFRAEEYGVDLEAGFAVARQRVDAEVRRRAAADVPGDTHRKLSVQLVLSRVRFRHVLLPVWIAAYRYRGRVHRFLVNGQTGEVVGKAPLSWVKVTLFSLALVALAVLLYWVFGRKPGG